MFPTLARNAGKTSPGIRVNDIAPSQLFTITLTVFYKIIAPYIVLRWIVWLFVALLYALCGKAGFRCRAAVHYLRRLHR